VLNGAVVLVVEVENPHHLTTVAAADQFLVAAVVEAVEIFCLVLNAVLAVELPFMLLTLLLTQQIRLAQTAQTGLPNYLVAEVADLAEIVILRVLVVMAAMEDCPLVVAEVPETLVLLLPALAVMAVTVWFVFILGNQL
jgi:hypothetical protein